MLQNCLCSASPLSIGLLHPILLILRTLSQYPYLSIPEHLCFSTFVYRPGLCLFNGLFSGLSHVPAPLPYLAPLGLQQNFGNLAILLPSSLFFSKSLSSLSPSPRDYMSVTQ